jgi:CHAT domain-containing protein
MEVAPNVPFYSALILGPTGDNDSTTPDPHGSADQIATTSHDASRILGTDISRSWKLDADLVTLAGCSSRLGPYRESEGHIGLPQAFLIAGARRVVATQWPVGDRATALLMLRFYQNLAADRRINDRPSASKSLHEAKRWLRDLTNDQAVKILGEFEDSTRGITEQLPIAKESHPFQHPFFWAGFTLVGTP